MLYNQAHQMSHHLLLSSEHLAMARGNLDRTASAGCPPSSFTHLLKFGSAASVTGKDFAIFQFSDDLICLRRSK